MHREMTEVQTTSCCPEVVPSACGFSAATQTRSEVTPVLGENPKRSLGKTTLGQLICRHEKGIK